LYGKQQNLRKKKALQFLRILMNQKVYTFKIQMKMKHRPQVFPDEIHETAKFSLVYLVVYGILWIT